MSALNVNIPESLRRRAQLLAQDDGQLQLRIQKVDRKPKIGYTALGWAVADIRKTVRQLSKAGVEFTRYDGLDQDADAVWRAPSGARVAWFRDPDDNTLSLTEYPR